MAAVSYSRISVIQRPKTNFIDFGSACFGLISTFICSPRRNRTRLHNQLILTRNITCTTGMAQIYPSRVLQKRTSTHHLRINTGVEQSLANSCSSQESASSYLYHYNPLRESTSIRIFQLEPGEEGVPLRCTIEHVDVNSGVKFSAVSYVVGSEKTSDRILVGADQYISLTASLHEVLQNLRGIENIEQKTFWADQICIDKHNTDERNQQVALMGTVYRKAAQVITYIGPETLNDRKGISLIQTINNLWEKIQHLHPDLDSTVVKSIVERHLPEENGWLWLDHLSGMVHSGLDDSRKRRQREYYHGMRENCISIDNPPDRTSRHIR
jgi:hypothetical protein